MPESSSGATPSTRAAVTKSSRGVPAQGQGKTISCSSDGGAAQGEKGTAHRNGAQQSCAMEE